MDGPQPKASQPNGATPGRELLELSELSELSDGFRTFGKLFDSAHTWSQAKKLSDFRTFGLSELSDSFRTFGNLSESAFGLSDRGSGKATRFTLGTNF